MPLPLTVNDGDFAPYLKYNAKAGRFYIKSDSGEVEIQNPKLVFDMEHIKTGWIYYEQGSGPEKVWDSNGVAGPKPVGGKKFKRGFEVMVWGAGEIGLREFSSTATNCITAILGMYSDYESATKTNPGKLPVFELTGVKPITGLYGTNYEPSFKLTSWTERSKIPDLANVAAKANSENPGAGLTLDDDIPFEMSWK